MIESSSVYAGDTVTWLRELPDYPAPAHVLNYALSNADNVIKFVAVAESAAHRVLILPSESAAWAPGRYDWAAFVTTVAGLRKVVDQGVMLIRANPAATQARDGRTHARRMLDAIEAALEQRATTDQLDMVRATFGQRSIERGQGQNGGNPTLIVARDTYMAEVAAEERAAAVLRGEKSGNKLHVRFTRP